LHRAAAAFLARFLQIKSHRKTVVVTHHAPSASSVPPEHSGDWTSAAYASDLENLIKDFGPAVWVHGHVHERLRYRIGKTTIVCNPRGYPGERSFEDFDREHVIEF
jgi:Icc-related predicted phosphoesterase